MKVESTKMYALVDDASPLQLGLPRTPPPVMLEVDDAGASWLAATGVGDELSPPVDDEADGGEVEVDPVGAAWIATTAAGFAE